MLQSNSFDTTWIQFQSSVTSGQAGYDGSSDAWLLTDTATSGDHRFYVTNSHSGVYTLSIYAKAGTKSIVYIQSYNSGFDKSDAYFDLSTGSVLLSGSDIESKIESIGDDGWYRCSMSYNDSYGFITIGLAESSTRPYVGDGTGSIYIQDAMLNEGLVAYPYVETTTAPVAGGTLEDMPRLDYTDSSCPALLLEPQRTNLIRQSEYFVGFPYNTNPDISITSNFSQSIEGVENATKLTYNGNSTLYTLNSISLIPSTTYTFSLFVKNIDSQGYFALGIGGGLNSSVWFNMQTMSVSNATSSGITGNVTPYGNDWYRFSVTGTTASTLRDNYFLISHSDTPQTSWFPNTPNSGKSVLIYGWQVEQNASYPTSYIPTYGTSQTRLKDLISKDLTSVVNGNEMTMFLDLKSHISIGRRTIDIWGDLRWYHKSSNRILFYKQDDAINVSEDIVVDTRTKIALSITTAEVKVFVNGSQHGSTTSLPTPFVNFGQFTYNINDSKEEWNQFTLFPTALSDDECIALTTIS